ncbi:MAG: thermonuclease family protein [Patescibacteria group bacterium]
MRYKIILIALIAFSCAYASYSSAPRSKYDRKISKIDPDEKYQVTNILDGDTFDIRMGKITETVRMIGIDTPETVDPRKPVQCFGKEASEMTKSMLSGRSVMLKIDKNKSNVDKFGRLLAYAYRDDGLFMNRFLLENGFAREYTYGKAYSLQKEFRKVEKLSKDTKLGLWKKCE